MCIEVSDRTIKIREENISEHYRRLKASGICAQFVTYFKRLKSTIPLSSLDSITLDSFKKIFGWMGDYKNVYQGLTADAQLEKPVK